MPIKNAQLDDVHATEDGYAATTQPSKRFPWRAALTGFALSPITIYWICFTEIVVNGPDLVAMSLIMAVVAALLVIIAVNVIVKKVAPKYAFNQSELLLIYVINSTSAGIGGLGMIQFLVNQCVGAAYYTTPENHWNQWTHFLRPWAYASPNVVAAYYKGHSSFYTAANVSGWLAPVAVWTCFIFVLLLAMYCISTLLRRQWVERERLLFPIVIIPLEITQNGGASPLWSNKLFWGGFCVATIVEVLATLHYTVSPAVPYIPIKPGETVLNIGRFFNTPPLNGIGALVLAFYPLVIGLAFLLALDVSFSVWFFYLFDKAENVFSVVFGFKDPGAPASISRIPYITEQGIGGFTALALISLFFAYPHLKKAFQHAFSSRENGDKRPAYPDDDEPMSYRAAYIALFVCMALLIGFGMAVGLPLLLAAFFFLMFLLWCIAFSRIRAEAGLPWGTGPGNLVHGAMVNLGGSENFSAQSLSAIGTLRWFDADLRTVAMPAQLEAMKLADASPDASNGRIHPRTLTKVVLIGIVVATISAWLSCLSIYYHYGAASAIVNSWRTGNGHYGFDEVQAWLMNQKPFDTAATEWAVGGFLMTVLLSVMRTRFVWWPFHPIGYVVATTGIDWIWCPIFVGWLAKKLILRYGGMKAYRTSLPFFYGLVIGDFVISALGALITALFHMPGYRTFPI